MYLKLERYNYKAWQVTYGRLAPATYEGGRNAGQPNPNAGQLEWTNMVKYPGNLSAAINHVIDACLADQTFVISNEAELQAMLSTLNESVQNFAQHIEDILVESDSFILEVAE